MVPESQFLKTLESVRIGWIRFRESFHGHLVQFKAKIRSLGAGDCRVRFPIAFRTIQLASFPSFVVVQLSGQSEPRVCVGGFDQDGMVSAFDFGV